MISGSFILCPQLKQKEASRGSSVLQFGQRLDSDVPQAIQNCAWAGFAVWQLGHSIKMSSPVTMDRVWVSSIAQGRALRAPFLKTLLIYE